MRIKYQIDCLNNSISKHGVIVINGSLLYWGTLMSFSHLRNYYSQPINRTNVWLYAKNRMRAAKKQFTLDYLPPKTLRLLSFLALNKEYNIDMLMEIPPSRGWPNQYTAFSSASARDDCYHFSVHMKFPYRSSIGHMFPIAKGQNFFFDVHFDYPNRELVLHDPSNRNDILDCDLERYVKTYYQKLIDDFKELDFPEEKITVENASYITKQIAVGIRVGMDVNLFEAGHLKEVFNCLCENGNTLCKSGIFIQIDKEDEFDEEK